MVHHAATSHAIIMASLAFAIECVLLAAFAKKVTSNLVESAFLLMNVRHQPLFINNKYFNFRVLAFERKKSVVLIDNHFIIHVFSFINSLAKSESYF